MKYQPDSTLFVLSWDMHGLESCINLSELDQERTFNTLANKPSQSINNLLPLLINRARFNQQRHYEIYTVHVDPSYTKEDLVEQFKEMPQEMANLIRDRGNKIYSDRITDRSAIKIQ